MSKKIQITPDLCIAARNLLRMTRPQLAQAAGLSSVTLKMYEEGTRGTEATRASLRNAFSAHGVTFTDGRTVQTIKRAKPPTS